jgi:hypothetical protein
VPVEQIQDYIVGWSHEEGDERWGKFRGPEKTHARPGGRSSYGEAWQCFDFLQALGVPLADEGEPGARTHAFAFPGMVIAHWRERQKGWFKRFLLRRRGLGGHVA